MQGINGNMHKELTLCSLFDGSGGFCLGAMISGIKPVASSEVEPFPILVTQKRLPEVKHYGDVSKISGYDLEPVDIITFGSPCQDLSIAGKRAGIKGERSGLFFQAIRIIKEMREATNGKYPRYAVYENVPGAFSSNGGDDFKAVLEAVIGVKEEGVEVPAPEDHRWPKADVLLGDGWSVAYRVLDAQYWGVPQRRARIYLVADFNGESAGEVLFVSEGLSGYTPQGFRSWQGAAAGAEEGSGETVTGADDPGRGDGSDGGEDGNRRYCVNTQGRSGVSVTEDRTDTIIAQDHGNHPSVLQAAGFSTEHSAKARSIGYEEEVSPTLRAGVTPAALLFDNHLSDARYNGPLDESPTVTARYGTGGNNQPLVAQPSYPEKPESSGESREDKTEENSGETPQRDTPKTLKIRSGKPGGGKGALWQENKSATLGTHNDQTLFQPVSQEQQKPGSMAFGICSKSSHAMLSDNPHSGFYEAKTSRTLDQSGGNAVTSNQGGIAIVSPVDEPETYDVRFTSKGTKNARGHCYKTDISRCLDTGGEDPDSNHGGVAVVERDPDYVAFTQNQRNEVRDLGEKSGAIAAEPGMKQQTFVLQGSMIGRDDKNGPQGSGVNEDVSFTLNTIDRHAVAFADKSATLSANDRPKGPSSQQLGNPSENFVGEVFHSSKNSYHTNFSDGNAVDTLVATDYKDPPTVTSEPLYIVRRLTPTECARLQGFPDWWCTGLEIPDPTEEQISFWLDVWNTWNSMNGKKPKTEKQVRKWLASPHTDAAEYKLWGNGVALPCVYFVLSGIAWAAEKDDAEKADDSAGKENT